MPPIRVNRKRSKNRLNEICRRVTFKQSSCFSHLRRDQFLNNSSVDNGLFILPTTIFICGQLRVEYQRLPEERTFAYEAIYGYVIYFN